MGRDRFYFHEEGNAAQRHDSVNDEAQKKKDIENKKRVYHSDTRIFGGTENGHIVGTMR